MVVGFSDWVGRMPMAALVAVMIMVCIGTFNWSSIRNLRTNPPSSSIVMLATVAVVVATSNLAYGVLVGVLLSGIFFAWKISQRFGIESTRSEDGRTRFYAIHGQVFFASTQQFESAFDFTEPVKTVVIDATNAHFWDVSAVGSLDKVVMRFRRRGVVVSVIGLNEESSSIVSRFGLHGKSDALDLAADH
ncbi:MAG: SulP family inorganic anion transporter [Thermomicrobiales bacterium]|nr:SulP family inorganic anion transporter [Thermomicrobiales bacterium]